METMQDRLKRARQTARSVARHLNPVGIFRGLFKLQSVELLELELEFIRTHMSTYLGNGVSLTHLLDETPIFVNSSDYGPPANFINGGRYEDEVLAVLLSFVRDDTVFVDVGANVGFYALQIAQRVKGHGKVHAFEPHPRLRDLVKRSMHLNGLRDTIKLHPYGLSDANAARVFAYPLGHLGGGGLHAENAQQKDEMLLHVRRMDDVFDEGFSCDLMKIDVEGHELFVFRGMERILKRSPKLKIVFENLESADAAPKRELEALLRQCGLSLYAIGGDACLQLLPEGALLDFDGYVLAALASEVGFDLCRRRLTIYPRQLHAGAADEQSSERLVAHGDARDVLFYGPYWFLARGGWRLRVEGDLGSGINLSIVTRSRVVLEKFKLTNTDREKYFTTERDLVHFECVGRARRNGTRVAIERIELARP